MSCEIKRCQLEAEISVTVDGVDVELCAEHWSQACESETGVVQWTREHMKKGKQDG